MLTVWSVLNGQKYDDGDVYTLREMVSRHLERPHVFRCLSDRDIPGVDCLVTDEQWPGWWSKLLLLRYATGHNLYLDLDVVIVGPLDDLISERMSMPKNWAQSGHGGCQSSVMSWGLEYDWIPDMFDADLLAEPERGNCGSYRGLWGDQEFITAVAGDPGGDVIAEMHGIYSYKYHCQSSLPEDAKVVCFHGRPKPHEVSDPWVVESRSMPIPA